MDFQFPLLTTPPKQSTAKMCITPPLLQNVAKEIIIS
jgi:hypothetical protein